MKSACIAICVDDFGLHEGITRSVIALAEQGRVNGVGCMVAGPAWDSARGEAAALRAGGVDIGLHLDLTEHPVDVRLRKPLPRLILDACLGRLPEMQLEHEIRAQLDRFEQQLGHAPDYIDGHRHVHQLPQVRSVLLRCLTPRGEQPWLRSTRRAKNLVAPRQASVAERVKPGLVEALGGRGLERALHWANLRRNRRLLGLYGFSAEETRYRAWIDAWLQAAEDEDLLMCHPAPHSDSRDAIADARAVEHRVLASAWMGEALARHGVTPARLSRLLVQTPTRRP